MRPTNGEERGDEGTLRRMQMARYRLGRAERDLALLVNRCREIPAISRLSSMSRWKRDDREESIGIHPRVKSNSVTRAVCLIGSGGKADPVSYYSPAKNCEEFIMNYREVNSEEWFFSLFPLPLSFSRETRSVRSIRWKQRSSSNCDLSWRTCLPLKWTAGERDGWQTLVSSCTRFSSCIHVYARVCTEGSCGPLNPMKGNEEPVTGRSHVGF